jgi:tRNA(fMet)-specific endonuclease VapC
VSRFLLDTNMMGHFINRRKGVDISVRDARLKGDVVGTCLPVVCELFFGVEYSATRDKNRKRLIRALTGVVCWPLDRKASEEYGRVAADLKKAGRLIQQIDIQIAAIALTLGDCTVVSADSDFAAMRGLKVVNWLAMGS